MVNPTPQGTTAHDAIRERRRQLQSKRRWRQLAGLWRTSVLLTLTGGLVWGLTLPDWVIRRPEQVVIRGNQLLKTEALQAQLPLEYPGVTAAFAATGDHSCLRNDAASATGDDRPPTLSADTDCRSPRTQACRSRHLQSMLGNECNRAAVRLPVAGWWMASDLLPR